MEYLYLVKLAGTTGSVYVVAETERKAENEVRDMRPVATQIVGIVDGAYAKEIDGVGKDLLHTFNPLYRHGDKARHRNVPPQWRIWPGMPSKYLNPQGANMHLYAVNTSTETEEDLVYVVASDAPTAIRDAGGIGAMMLGEVEAGHFMRSGAVVCPIANFQPLYAG